MNRRFFLKSAAGTALAAPFLTSLRDNANAQTALAPQRCFIFHSPCGCLTNRWFPTVEDGPLSARDLAGTTLEVLAPYVDKLLFPRGLRANNAYGKPQTIDPHAQAMAKLTCALIDGESRDRYALSHSLDHEIARQVNPNGAPPLVVGAKPSSLAIDLVSYSAARQPYVAQSNPQSVFLELSGLLVDPTGESEIRRRRGQSILDAVRDDLQTYQRLDMSQRDRQRVDAWLELVRGTEAALGVCDKNRVGLDETELANSGMGDVEGAFTTDADLMMKLSALAMLCDLNRSMVMTFTGYVFFDWDGVHLTKDHDGLAHRTGDFSVGGACLEGVIDMLDQIDHWYAAKYAKLVELLASVPEGDVSLLDNTATVWMQEVSDGSAMNLNNMPIVIAGSAGGYLRQGRSVRLESEPIGPGNSDKSCDENGNNTPGASGSTGGNVPINKLFVTLLNAMGCKGPDGGDVTSFGLLDSEVAEAGITDPGELNLIRA